MRKILKSIVSFAAVMCISVNVFAAEGTISIKNNINGSQPVTYTYTEKSGQVVKSIKTLMTKLSDLEKEDSIVQTITVTSQDAVLPVSVSLRLDITDTESAQEGPQAPVSTPSPEEYEALSYYNIEIFDASGNKVYSDNDIKESDETNNTYRDIPLGIINESRADENQIYNISVKADKGAKSSVKTYAEDMDWCIVTETVNLATSEPSATSTPAATIAVTSAPTALPSSTPNSGTVDEDKDGTYTLSPGEFLVGRDIDEGRYTMTGDGKVHVYTSEDVLKTSIVLKKKNSKSSGVEEYVINLQDGERLEVDNDTVLTPYSASSRTAKPTSSPKVSSSASSNATNKPSSSTSSSSKDNPKTGDNTPITALISLSVVAVCAVVFIEIRKRKKD